jgi:GH18 family chitinase
MRYGSPIIVLPAAARDTSQIFTVDLMISNIIEIFILLWKPFYMKSVLLKSFTLKYKKPGLKVWLSIGGWAFNDWPGPTSFTFSDLVGSTIAQSKFFASLLTFMSQYGFDGIDMDWYFL